MVKLQTPLLPGGTVVGPAWPWDSPEPRKMLEPSMAVPEAAAAPRGNVQSGRPVSASYAAAEKLVVEGAKTTPLLYVAAA